MTTPDFLAFLNGVAFGLALLYFTNLRINTVGFWVLAALYVTSKITK